MIDIKVPTVGESINEVTLVKWRKNDGDYVERDEVIAELESEKATFEVNAEEAGKKLTNINEGDTAKIGDVIASINTDVPVPAIKKEETKPAVQPPPVAPQAAVAGTPADIKATPVAAAIIADK